MLNSRNFLRNIILIDKIYASCKCSSNGKPNIIKTLNSENKYLYGSLLETQKQRRKGLRKVVTKNTEIDNGLDLTNNNSENEGMNIKACQKRGRKPKCSKTVTILACDSSTPILNVANPDGTLPAGASHQSVESDLLNPEETQKRTRKLKTNNKSPNSKPVNLPPNEFVFKSKVPINETNYPLENLEKIISSHLASGTVLNYSFSDSVIKQYVKFPSVSKIMEETMSDKNKSILSKWRQNMIGNLGAEGFSKHCEDLKKRGHDFHSAVCDTVVGKPRGDWSEVTQNALKSLEWMLKHVSNPLAVESITAHPNLEYKGIPDCVVHFRGIPVIVDWKLSDKPKKDLKDTYDAPVQITAYMGALNHDPNYKWAVNHGLVAVAYTNGDPCDVFLLAPKHCQIYWRHWLLRCDKFKARSHLHTDHVIDETTL